MKDSRALAHLVNTARDPSASLQAQHAAFAQLVGRTQHIAFGLALASLRDVDEARDAAQDAFITAWHRLPQLRDSSAFVPWLKAIVATACARRRRRRAPIEATPLLETALEPSLEPDDGRMDYQAIIASALERLPEGERRVTILFYFLGYTLPQIGKLMRLKPGTVGKRLHSARLRIRRGLPRSVRADFVRLEPSKDFVERVSRGLLDEYVGTYRFDRRPDLVVSITREGDTLVSDGGGQRHALVCVGQHSLLTFHYDGEGRFKRNRRGDVTHFVYYEFGKRMGVARKLGA